VRLLVVALHLLGIAVWVGGLTYQTHVLLPVARRGRAEAFVEAARRGRPATWVAVGLVVLTGFYNVTQLGPLARVAQSGAGLMLAGKFILVIAAVSLAAQRDFSLVPRLAHAVGVGEDPRPALRTIAALDHMVLLLAVVMIYLGVAISRA
jgi:putative copper export protein